MAILQVTSNDENFSFIIKKNPESGMQLRGIRKGTAFGWFSKQNTAYNILFKDADNAVSFGDQEFEYLNTSRFNSPLFILNAINEYFGSTVKEQTDLDVDGIEKTVFINLIEIKSIAQLFQFEKYFPEFSIDYKPKVSKSYSLTISTKKSFHLLFNYLNLLTLFISLTSDEYIQVDSGTIEKYMNAIERLNAPFFIRYLFSRNILNDKNNFEKYKPRLENSNLYHSMNMCYGDTATQRRSKIKTLLAFDKPILDVGCGEGFYALSFASILKNDNIYHAVDIDKTLTKVVTTKASRKNIDNISTHNHIDEFLEIYDGETVVDILLTEVIEHMPIEQSEQLIQKILAGIKFDKFIITVPNKEFNQFYMIGADEFRHSDHDWEPTFEQFTTFIQKTIPTTYKLNFLNMGDTVNGISTSIGCVVMPG